ncbi:hypothetical protein BSKO_10699 [Bryopsis sp. KO-2023]|nr:hypothetical protein BSKO_10699 [Bryopsis sp. KO-2023]
MKRGTLRYNESSPRKFMITRTQSMAAMGRADGALLDEKHTEETLAKLKKMGGFESMDYDPVENDLEREINIHREHHDYNKADMWKWLIAAMIGVVMGIVGFFVDFSIETLNTMKFRTVSDLIIKDGVRVEGGPLIPYIAFAGISIFLAGIAGALVSYIEPLAAGSGIPELKTYLNGVHIRGLLQVKTFISKIIGIMFSISSGLIAGKEGPFVHGGGIVGGGLGGMGSRTLTMIFGDKVKFKSGRRLGGYFRNDADHRDFSAIGTAAGVATAFAAPIGGLLFTIEEGCSFYSTGVMWKGFLSTSMGVLTLHFLVEAIKSPDYALHVAKFGRYRDFGLYSDNYAKYGDNLFYYFWEIPIFMLMGAVFGLLGAGFVWMNVKITSWRHKNIPVKSAWKRTVEVMVVAFVTASIGFWLSYISPCGKTPKDKSYFNPHQDDLNTSGNAHFYQGGGELEYFPQLWCEDDHYSIYGQIFFTPLTSALRLLMHLGESVPDNHPEWEFTMALICITFVYSYVLMTWTYGVGAATGLFVPSMVVGASGGRIVGRVVHFLLEKVTNGNFEGISLPCYAIIGSAASLGGATRMTISICVLVMETTGSLQLIVPIMVAVMCAKAVGDAFGLGIYDTHIEIRGAPFLEEHNFDYHLRMIQDKLRVKELMSDEMVCLPPAVKLTELAHILRNTTHGAFPVTNDAVGGGVNRQGINLEGVVTRIQLLRMMQNRVGFIQEEEFNPFSATADMIPHTQPERLSVLERLEQVPLKIRAKEDQERILSSFTAEEMETFIIDLRPFIQKHPFCINANASLSRAYRLFRTMGLRHLFVIPDQPRVVGIITRKDVTKDNATLVLGEKVNTLEDEDSKEFGRQVFAHPRPSLPFLPLPALEEKGTAPVAPAGGLNEPLLSPHSPYSRGVTFFTERRSASVDYPENQPQQSLLDEATGNNNVEAPVDVEALFNGETLPNGNNAAAGGGMDVSQDSYPDLDK